VGGFGTLLFSSFDGTFYVGLLIGLTLLFGVVAELTLLPLLILGIYGRKRKFAGAAPGLGREGRP
jgi:predicted RND superfamily exporter protein